MRSWLKKNISRQMVRPIVYKALSRFAYVLAAALVFNRFMSKTPIGLSSAFALAAVGFLAAAWVAHLRADGVRLPRLPAKRLRLKDKPEITFGDMIDHVDEKIVNFEDLETGEQDACLIVADIACAAAYVILSFAV